MRKLLLLSVMLLPMCAAADSTELDRDEVAGLKKRLQAVTKALGSAPAGYSQQEENYNLPTEAYQWEKGWQPTQASVTRRFGGDLKGNKKAQEDMGEQFQKKYAAAMSKGDYQEMQRLAEEMQKDSGKLGAQNMEASSIKPVEVRITLNEQGDSVIDPDKVVAEQPGLIALKDGDADNESVTIYVDGADLKNTKKLSRVYYKVLEKPAASKTEVKTVTIVLRGPADKVEAWAKKANAAAILAALK